MGTSTSIDSSVTVVSWATPDESVKHEALKQAVARAQAEEEACRVKIAQHRRERQGEQDAIDDRELTRLFPKQGIDCYTLDTLQYHDCSRVHFRTDGTFVWPAVQCKLTWNTEQSQWLEN